MLRYFCYITMHYYFIIYYITTITTYRYYISNLFYEHNILEIWERLSYLNVIRIFRHVGISKWMFCKNELQKFILKQITFMESVRLRQGWCGHPQLLRIIINSQSCLIVANITPNQYIVDSWIDLSFIAYIVSTCAKSCPSPSYLLQLLIAAPIGCWIPCIGIGYDVI